MLQNHSSPDHDLISSLHRHGSATFSASSGWRIWTNQLAQDDVRRERIAARRTFRGRRLSYDDNILLPPIQSSDSGEDYFAHHNRNTGIGIGRLKQEQQLPDCLNALSYSSASSSSSSPPPPPPPSLLGKKEKQQKAMAMPTTHTVAQNSETGNRRCCKWALGLPLLAFASASASVLMLILSVCCCLGFRAYDQQQLPFLLVPT